MNIILASKSPRRFELLNRLIEKFVVIESNFDENSVKYNGDPEEYVKQLSLGKAKEVSKGITENSIIIAADTIVFYEDKILGKPKDIEEAYSMISALSGNTHKVYSGVCTINTENNTTYCDVCCTDVKFSNITKAEIYKYIESGEPFDKAGAYGIQGLGGVFVEEIRGCYYNVVGLPLNKTKKLLSQHDIKLL